MNDGVEAVSSVEDALVLIGGFGKFQWISSIITLGNYVRVGWTIYPLPYMELFPVYKCTSPTSPTPYTCEAEDFCGDPSISYTVDWSEDTSLHNWVEQLDLVCKADN